MKSIIMDIFYGRRGMEETVAISKEYGELLGKIADASNAFEATLTPEQKAAFTDICFLHAGLESEAIATHYAEEFKVGMLLAIESLNG